jgi:hypothetical protein
LKHAVWLRGSLLRELEYSGVNINPDRWVPAPALSPWQLAVLDWEGEGGDENVKEGEEEFGGQSMRKWSVRASSLASELDACGLDEEERACVESWRGELQDIEGEDADDEGHDVFDGENDDDENDNDEGAWLRLRYKGQEKDENEKRKDDDANNETQGVDYSNAKDGGSSSSVSNDDAHLNGALRMKISDNEGAGRDRENKNEDRKMRHSNDYSGVVYD